MKTKYTLEFTEEEIKDRIDIFNLSIKDCETFLMEDGIRLKYAEDASYDLIILKDRKKSSSVGIK